MSDKTNKPRRGRPARLSREEILQAGLALLEKDPAALTLNGVARTLGRAPMSLYTHVQDRDDLLLGISELVLGKLRLNLDGDHWEIQVRQWAGQVKQHLVQYPQVLNFIGDQRQVPLQWLRIQAQLARVLHQAGLAEDSVGKFADLISQATVFDAIHWQAMSSQVQALTSAALLQLGDEDRRYIHLVIDSATAGNHSLLDFTLEQTLDLARDTLLKT